MALGRNKLEHEVLEGATRGRTHNRGAVTHSYCPTPPTARTVLITDLVSGSSGSLRPGEHFDPNRARPDASTTNQLRRPAPQTPSFAHDRPNSPFTFIAD